MHLELLTEGNGIAALAKPTAEIPRVPKRTNGASGLVSQSMIATIDEEWIDQDIIAVISPGNRSIVPMDEAEEARILSHPDVAAAIDAVLPEIEAWERA